MSIMQFGEYRNNENSHADISFYKFSWNRNHWSPMQLLNDADDLSKVDKMQNRSKIPSIYFRFKNFISISVKVCIQVTTTTLNSFTVQLVTIGLV